MVEPVQVESLRVHAVVAIADPVGVDHGHDFEDEELPEEVGLQVVVVEEEVQHALQAVGGGHLAWVHARCDEHHWPPLPPLPLLPRPLSHRQQMHSPLLGGQGQHFVSIIDGGVHLFLDGLKIALIIGVGEGNREADIDFLIVFEGMIDD